MITWYVEQDVFTDDEDLVEIINHYNYYDIYATYLTDNNWPKIQSCVKEAGPSIYRGSLKNLHKANKYPWVPGVFCDLRKFKCSYYYPRLRQFLCNKNYIILPYGEVRERYKNNTNFFIRPDTGFKIFTGQAVEDKYDWEIIDFNKPDPEELVVISSVKNILAEFRFVVIDSKPVSGTRYPDCKGPPGSSVYTFVEKVAKTYSPERIYTMDVCICDNGEPYLLELNSFSCAGLYKGLDLDKIMVETNKVIVEEWEDFIS